MSIHLQVADAILAAQQRFILLFKAHLPNEIPEMIAFRLKFLDLILGNGADVAEHVTSQGS